MPLKTDDYDPALADIVDRVNQNEQQLIERGLLAGGNGDIDVSNLDTAADVPPVDEPAPVKEEGEPEKVEVVPPVTPPPGDPEKEALEARWKTADGIAKATGAQLSQTQQHVKELEERLAQIQVQREAVAKDEKKEEPTETETKLVVKLVDLGFDEETAKELVVHPRHLVEAETKPLREQIEPVRQKIERVEAEWAWEGLKSRLRQEAPAFDELDSSPEFHQWLGAGDRQTLRDFANTAIYHPDAAIREQAVLRVAAFYNTYKKLNPPAAVEAAPSNPNPSDAQRTAIAAQVQPAPRSASPVTSGQRRMPAAKARQMYQEIARGDLPEAEVTRIKRELDEMYDKGRIDP